MSSLIQKEEVLFSAQYLQMIVVLLIIFINNFVEVRKRPTVSTAFQLGVLIDILINRNGFSFHLRCSEPFCQKSN